MEPLLLVELLAVEFLKGRTCDGGRCWRDSWDRVVRFWPVSRRCCEWFAVDRGRGRLGDVDLDGVAVAFGMNVANSFRCPPPTVTFVTAWCRAVGAVVCFSSNVRRYEPCLITT